MEDSELSRIEPEVQRGNDVVPAFCDTAPQRRQRQHGMIGHRLLSLPAYSLFRPDEAFGFLVAINHETPVQHLQRLGVERSPLAGDAEQLRQGLGIERLQAGESLRGGFGDLDVGMSVYLRADDPKRRLPHVDDKTRLPDRQAEKRLVIGNCCRAELRFLGEESVFDAGIDRITLRRAAEILQLLGFRSYKVT